MEPDIIEIDEENKKVLVYNLNELDPNGYPVIVEYTSEEWYTINTEQL
jgi:hypothetical protein